MSLPQDEFYKGDSVLIRTALNMCNKDKITGSIIFPELDNIKINGNLEVSIYFKSNWVKIGRLKEDTLFTYKSIARAAAELAEEFNKTEKAKGLYACLNDD